MGIGKIVLTMLIGTLGVSALSAKNYDLNEKDSIDLSGVEAVVFNLQGVSCSMCVKTADINSELRGDGSGGSLSLALTGKMSSNRDKAVPSLIANKSGKTLTIRLYPERESFFGLSQSGKVTFSAVLPAGFQGKVSVEGSSDDISLLSFNLRELDVRSSSGDLTAKDVQAGKASMRLSSGKITGSGIRVENELLVESSSGDLDLNELQGGEILIEASSGEIKIGSMEAAGALSVKASSGDISADSLSGGKVSLDSSSGKIEIRQFKADAGSIEASSGDIRLGSVAAGSLELILSSGDLVIGTLDALSTSIRTSGGTDITSASGSVELSGSSGDAAIGFSSLDSPVEMDVSSGDITLKVPSGSGFDVKLKANSGRIRSDFPVLGNLADFSEKVIEGPVNGGGVPVVLTASSGNITLVSR